VRRGGDRTEAGGVDGRFRTTHWTQIRRARTLDDARRRAVLDQVLTRYWKPVYCFLRRRGHDNETAKDLTQGFFQEVVLGRDLVQRAEADRGRFRTFLLTALDHYVTSVHRAASAQRRDPGEPIVSIEGLGPGTLPEPAPSTNPVEAFNYAWASALLDAVLEEVERDYVARGRETHWAVFHARVIAPIMDGEPPPPLGELCERHGIRSEMTASNMIVTVKRRFQTVMREHVRQFVESDADVDQEIQELIAMLSRGRG
jgi:RNA polymerase sigma-70 factor (ECF subfamily)